MANCAACRFYTVRLSQTGLSSAVEQPVCRSASSASFLIGEVIDDAASELRAEE